MMKIIFFLCILAAPVLAQLTAPGPDSVYTITKNETVAITNGIRKLQSELTQYIFLKDTLVPLYRLQILDYSRLMAEKNAIILNDSERIALSIKNDSLYQHSLEEAKGRSFWENPYFLIAIGITGGVILRSKF